LDGKILKSCFDGNHGRPEWFDDDGFGEKNSNARFHSRFMVLGGFQRKLTERRMRFKTYGIRSELMARHMNYFVSAIDDGIDLFKLFHTDENVDGHLIDNEELTNVGRTTEAHREFDHC